MCSMVTTDRFGNCYYGGHLAEGCSIEEPPMYTAETKDKMGKVYHAATPCTHWRSDHKDLNLIGKYSSFLFGEYIWIDSETGHLRTDSTIGKIALVFANFLHGLILIPLSLPIVPFLVL